MDDLWWSAMDGARSCVCVCVRVWVDGCGCTVVSSGTMVATLNAGALDGAEIGELIYPSPVLRPYTSLGVFKVLFSSGAAWMYIW